MAGLFFGSNVDPVVVLSRPVFSHASHENDTNFIYGKY